MIVASYGAEQHLLHFGRADAPMCWTLCGLISGYISRVLGSETYVLEGVRISWASLRATFCHSPMCRRNSTSARLDDS